MIDPQLAALGTVLLAGLSTIYWSGRAIYESRRFAPAAGISAAAFIVACTATMLATGQSVMPK